MSDHTPDSDSPDPDSYDIIAEAQEIAELALASPPLPAINLTTDASLPQPVQTPGEHSGSLIGASEPVLPLHQPTNPMPAFHPAHYLRLLNKRQRRRGRFSDLRLVSIVLLLLLLLGIATPLVLVAGYGLKLYNTYNSIHAHATSGFQHLQALKTLFEAGRQPGLIEDGKPADLKSQNHFGSHPAGMLDST